MPDRVGSPAWWYTLELLGSQVGAMIVVSASIGVSTVLFQTITTNRILTPSIIGFDALYLLLQTMLVWFVTSVPNGALSFLDNPLANYALSAGLMIIFALALYSWLLLGRKVQLMTLLLVGLVIGLVFRSFTSLFMRLLDPTAFIQVRAAMFANFSYVDRRLLIVTAIITIIGIAVAYRRRRNYDVMLLGRDPAISLGINYRRETIIVLFLCAVLVASSTALVGPVLFFGLIVANGAYQLLSTQRHSHTLPMAVALGVAALAGGQLALRQFGVEGSLSVAVEFIGGALFLFLLLRGRTS
nr:iron chelate uptake ABC transporter family permease subunit [Corynebacterium sp. TAE3-ERU12]